jgi:FkbM family methyltransferase
MSDDSPYVSVGDFLCLKDDPNHTPKSVEAGTIMIENTILDLPEIKNLHEGQVVLDIGAFIGYVARGLSESGATVHSFEAFPDAAHCLKHNAPMANCYNEVVGNGERVIRVDKPFEENGNFGTRYVKLDESGNPSLRIDDLDFPRVDLIKIDVEGFEPYVLLGAVETIAKYQPVIIVEAYNSLLAVHGFNRYEHLIRPLLSWGYSVQVAVGFEVDDRVDYVCHPRRKT